MVDTKNATRLKISENNENIDENGVDERKGKNIFPKNRPMWRKELKFMHENKLGDVLSWSDR